MKGPCLWSLDRKYRYLLERRVGPSEETCLFICLNASKADEEIDDLTVTKGQHWAAEWGFGVFVMANIFGYKATDPEELYPLGDDAISHPDERDANDEAIAKAVNRADRIVLGWGNHGAFLNRGLAVLDYIRGQHRSVWCFGQTQDGHPKHPSRIAYASPFVQVERGLIKVS